MTDSKKPNVPDEIPVPPVIVKAKRDEPSGEIDEEKVSSLVNGEISFQEFFELSDEVLFAWANKGYFFYNQGKFDDACTIFEGLVALNPRYGYFHTALGAVYEAQKKYEEALSEFNLAIELNEKDVCALVNRGEMYLRQGEVVKAAEDFQAGISFDEQRLEELRKRGEEAEPDPAAQRARALSRVAYEVLKELEDAQHAADLEDGKLDTEEEK